MPKKPSCFGELEELCCSENLRVTKTFLGYLQVQGI